MQRKNNMVIYDTFKFIPQYKGLVYTGHRSTIAKVSNDILIGLTDQGKTWVTKYYQLFGFLKKKL